MKIRRLIATLGAATLLLAGCGSGAVEGAATQATGESTPVTSTSSTAPDATSDAGPSSASESGQTTTSEEPEQPQTPSGSVSLDSATKEWLGATCEGALSMFELMEVALAGATGDPAEAKDTAVNKLDEIGTKLLALGAEMAMMPPPSFGGGDAEEAPQLFVKAGQYFQQAAKDLADRTITSSEEYYDAIGEVLSGMDDIGGIDGSELGGIDLSVPEAEAAMAQVPECAPVLDLVNSFGDAFDDE